MANGIFNNALGKVAYYANLPATNDGIIVVLLKVVEADDTLNNYDTLSALLAGSNTEADFTNYARMTAANVTVTVDDSGNAVKATFDALVYTNAGGTTDNSIVKLITCYDPDTTGGTDADLIPLTYHDAVFTTDGTTQTLNCPTEGFFSA